MDPIVGRLITIAGSFLILSLVAEKLADLLKLRNKKLSIKTKSSVAEKERERAIVTRTVVVGIIIAVCLKADAIQMIVSGEPGEVLGWENIVFYDEKEVIELTSANYGYFSALHGDGADGAKTLFLWIQMFVGMVITGVALSFGSKFWHDLLGLLYEIKNAKAQLNAKSLENEGQ